MILSRQSLPYAVRHNYVLRPAIGQYFFPLKFYTSPTFAEIQVCLDRSNALLCGMFSLQMIILLAILEKYDPKTQSIADHPVFSFLRSNSTISNAKGSKPHHTSELQKAPSPLSIQIRTLMRSQPHSLAAIVAPPEIDHPSSRLAKHRSPRDSDQQSALLVSSLNTVTLNPTPYISFNIKTTGSQTYRNIRASGMFTVSGLEDPKTAHAFVEKFEDRHQKEGRGGWRACIGEKGKVKRERGGSWWLLCKYRAGMSTKVGDHLIVVGQVLDAGSNVEESDPKQAHSTGLVYLNGKYRWVGQVATPEHLAGG